MIEVLLPGAYTTIQDLGRKGHEIHGMPPSGAFDAHLASVANALSGNPVNTPLLEFALAGPSLRFHRDTFVTLSAYRAAYLLNGSAVPGFQAFRVAAGSTLEFNGMQGWFGYLAFSGGLAADVVLGSASTYALGRIGKRLTKGDRLSVAPGDGEPSALPPDAVEIGETSVLRILPSIHTSLFPEAALQTLFSGEYRILPNSDRMAIALEGARIPSPRVVRSAPAFPGSIQVLPSGQLLLLGPEGPTTGGYPQIAVLSRTSWTALAQSRPGRAVRFDWITREESRRIFERRNTFFQRGGP